MPPEFGRDVDRLCVLELARELDAGDGEPPDAASELADAVSALRLATAGAIAAGPVVFERLDFRPLRISPLLPIAATQPLGEAIRLDALRARVAADLRERLPLADEDRELARGARPVGALALRRRAVPVGPGARRAHRAPRRGRWRLGGQHARGRAAAGEDEGARRARGEPQGAAGRLARARRAPAGARRDVAPRRPRPGSCRRWTRRCSGCGRRPRRACSRPARAYRTHLFQSCLRHVTASALPSETWTKRRTCSSGSSGSGSSNGGGPRPRSCSRSCVRSSARRSTGRGSRATRAPGRRRSISTMPCTRREEVVPLRPAKNT